MKPQTHFQGVGDSRGAENAQLGKDLELERDIFALLNAGTAEFLLCPSHKRRRAWETGCMRRTFEAIITAPGSLSREMSCSGKD